MTSAELADRVTGPVLRAGDIDYDTARALWNSRFGRRPDTIVRCADAADVASALEHARANGQPVSVKGGGHSYAANSVADGGVLIDLSPMRSISVDPKSATATIGGGVTCGELDAATQEHGLATPTPTVSSVGVAGAALGGGGGYLSRAHGLTIDNVLSARVVTADGRVVTASPSDNPDLFWAIRGGGGNFGVVVELELRLHPVGPEVLSGQIIYPFDEAGRLLRSYRHFMADAPDELQVYAFMFRVPPIDAFPAELHGDPVIDFVLCHQDPEATSAVQPLQSLGTPILDAVTPAPYVDVQQAFDPTLPAGQRYYSRAHDLADLSDAAIDTAVAHVPEMTGSFTSAYFDPGGGATARVDSAATAFHGREARYGFHILAGWSDASDDSSVIGWAADFHAAMARHATGGVYVNLLADDEIDRVPAAYGDNLARLIEAKRTWDPENVFRSNHNIAPN